jgi:hypothetical protein
VLLEERLDVIHCPSTDMIADALTKPLCAPAFVRCRDGLGVSPPPDRQLVEDRDV